MSKDRKRAYPVRVITDGGEFALEKGLLQAEIHFGPAIEILVMSPQVALELVAKAQAALGGPCGSAKLLTMAKR